jgi:hypothetical protein
VTIVDEPHSPRLRVLACCSACQRIFVRRVIDVSIDDSAEAKADHYAAQDIDRWIEHLAAYHNENHPKR